MSDLYKDTRFLRAVLAEAILELNDRNTAPKGTRDILRDSRLCEAVMLLLDRVEALEGK